MCGAVLLVHEVDVIGGHHLDAVLLRQFEYLSRIELLLLVQFQAHSRNLGLMEHHFKVIVVPEDALMPLNGGVSAGGIPGYDGARHFSGETGGAADEVGSVLLYHLVRHARTVVETLYVRD